MTTSYMLYIEPDVPGDVRAFLAEAIASDSRVSGWWNHMPGLYLIESDSNAAAMSAMVEPVVKPWSFLIMRADPADSQGWLPDRAWPWIQRHYA